MIKQVLWSMKTTISKQIKV